MVNKWVKVKTEDGSIIEVPYTAYLKDFQDRGCLLVEENPNVKTEKPNNDTSETTEDTTDKKPVKERKKKVTDPTDIVRPSTIEAHIKKPRIAKEK